MRHIVRLVVALRGGRDSLRGAIVDLVGELRMLNVLLAEVRDAMLETGADLRRTRKLISDIRHQDHLDRERIAREGGGA